MKEFLFVWMVEGKMLCARGFSYVDVVIQHKDQPDMLEIIQNRPIAVYEAPENCTEAQWKEMENLIIKSTVEFINGNGGKILGYSGSLSSEEEEKKEAPKRLGLRKF